jgi:hypothetical protein
MNSSLLIASDAIVLLSQKQQLLVAISESSKKTLKGRASIRAATK